MMAGGDLGQMHIRRSTGFQAHAFELGDQLGRQSVVEILGYRVGIGCGIGVKHIVVFSGKDFWSS